MNNIKRFLLFLLILFLMPIITGQLPFPNNKYESVQVPKEQKLVYASTELAVPEKKVLLVFTHSHEAYKPIVEASTGMKEVYNEQLNIFSLSKVMEEYLTFQGMQPKTLPVDLMTELKNQGKTISHAYKVARPFIADEIALQPYDMILDVHRDSAGKKTTTLTVGDTSYAKMAFVVGMEHANYKSNLAYAEKLHATLNGLVPGISRKVMKKEGEGVDGIYNQDLSPQMVLVEIGGIDNTEEEVTRTISVLSEAVAKVLQES
ncbi:stage II sporulation protein P [Lysinibacillus odysseyi]|uniref:Stage II sporulation protein P n=1 Tax=Lysinibacillus odysseyi 34hs-1 = NBRC 100172 TaxID=1220589 RepID=A0A0A3IL05_9BACI|nr:stage II sporulation protein P [Lysinibacillus odysseyi]KGR83508.1 stage II sporulation protein P [Lysinibacillus odysseyi 34hs-1 = NBRC 100172]